MTEHRATTRQWSGIERFVRYGAYDSCLIELRDRVEALEAAQRPTVEDSLTVPADSLAGRQPWAAMSFRGAMLLPPIDCADPDLWIAERIYEMGLADGKNATTGDTAPITRDRDETGDYLIIHDAPPPVGSLAEQGIKALGPEPLPETGPTGDTILNKGSIDRHHRICTASAEARPGGLLEGVANALHYAPHPIGNWNLEAGAAILAVADWFDQQELHIAAARLRMEVG
jgi:hypothetical protein